MTTQHTMGQKNVSIEPRHGKMPVSQRNRQRMKNIRPDRRSMDVFADRVNELIPTVMREFSRRQTNEFTQGRMSVPQFMILTFLEKKDRARMTDLSGVLGVSTAAVTGLVERLVKADYLVRGADVSDRRVIFISLTDKGRLLIQKINVQRKKMIGEVFSQLSDEDRKNYLSILERLHEILCNNRNES